MDNAAYSQSDAKYCVSCNGTGDTVANPLLVVSGEDADDPEYIHQHCANGNSDFGFCWCCGTSRVFRQEDLNEAGECEIHDGESVPDYPVEDAESFIENVRKDG